MEEKESKEEDKDMELKQKKEEKEEIEATATATTKDLRRSTRNPSQYVFSSSTFKNLVQKLETNHDDVVVLKCKEYVPDSNSSYEIIDAMLTALKSNKNCQALYLQVRDQTIMSFSITMIISYKVSYNLF